MSYILDALKKSELERTRNAAPSLIGTAPVPSRARARVLIIAAVALLANAAIFGTWWLWQGDTTQPQTKAVERPGVASDVAPASAAPQPVTPAVVPANEQPSTAVASTAPAPTAMSPPPVQPVAKPVPFNALSSDEQHAFDGLTFSTHLFADDPAFRAVTINGRQYKEGDALTNGLVLSEITEEGVVIGYAGKRVELPILQDWRL